MWTEVDISVYYISQLEETPMIPNTDITWGLKVCHAPDGKIRLCLALGSNFQQTDFKVL